VLAMLFLPAAAALPWTRRIPATLIAAVCLSLLFLAAGFVLSIEMDWPLSQSVGGAGFAILLTSHGLSALRRTH
jgi:ABC-type Mn2+/Zn2+ transport system permease subunit